MTSAQRRTSRPTVRPSRAPRGAGGRRADPLRRERSGSRPGVNRAATAPPTAGPGRRAGRTGSSSVGPRTVLPTSRLARQLAVLGIVLCAVALTVAFPLRGYLEQRSAQAAAVAEQADLQAQRTGLEAQVAALQDPDHIRTEARRRLQYVSPGDTVFTVHAPGEPVVPASAPAVAPPSQSWYSGLWETVTDPGTAPAGTP